MKKPLPFLVALGAAAVLASVALATPSQGTQATINSIGSLNGDVAFNTGLPLTGNGLTWGTKQYTADQLPEFLMARRAEGVTSLGDWLNLHPKVSAAFGLVPIGVLHSPEIVTQTVKFPPGAYSGWHTHPGFLVSTVHSGTLTRYNTDCSSQAFGAGQSWTETGTNTFIVVVVATLLIPTARGDGDPASDTLLVQSVFFPYSSPSQQAQAPLQQAVDGVYARGRRVKVALIYTQTDLGAIPSLFGKPGDYAHFLGIELGLWYAGPLLVVMPAGFGIYDAGRPTTAEDSVLRSLRVDASSPDGLARSATTAVQRLASASALGSADIKPPLVTVYPVSARRGEPATMHFDLFDDSGRSEAVVRVYESSRLVATLAPKMQFDIGTRRTSVTWPVPARLRSRKLRFCVVASDPSGNRSSPACAPFLRIT